VLAQSRQRTGGRNKGIDTPNNIHTWNSDLFGMVETGRVCVCGVLVGAGINVCVKPSNSLFLKKMSSPVPYVYNVLNKFGRIE